MLILRLRSGEARVVCWPQSKHAGAPGQAIAPFDCIPLNDSGTPFRVLRGALRKSCYMSEITDPLAWATRAEGMRIRYPGDDPTPEEAHPAVEIARSVRRLVRVWLGLSK